MAALRANAAVHPTDATARHGRSCLFPLRLSQKDVLAWSEHATESSGSRANSRGFLSFVAKQRSRGPCGWCLGPALRRTALRPRPSWRICRKRPSCIHHWRLGRERLGNGASIALLFWREGTHGWRGGGRRCTDACARTGRPGSHAPGMGHGPGASRAGVDSTHPSDSAMESTAGAFADLGDPRPVKFFRWGGRRLVLSGRARRSGTSGRKRPPATAGGPLRLREVALWGGPWLRSGANVGSARFRGRRLRDYSTRRCITSDAAGLSELPPTPTRTK